MPIATNPETGESVYLGNDGQWKPAPTAVHPETKQELIFDGSAWAPLKREQQGPQQPPPSRTEAFGRGFTSAGSFGFRDELAGLAAAGGAAPDEQDPAKTLFYLGRGAYRKLTDQPTLSSQITGKTETQRLYDEEVERQRAETKRYEEQQPGASLAGQVTGAIAMPLPALRAATLPGRALQAAGIGAATGALSGAGEAEGGLADRGRGALTGGLIGGAVGGVAAPILEGGIAAGRYLAGKPIELMRSAIAPGAQAERAIGRAYQQAAEADPAAARRLALGELGPGNPAVVADVLGQPGRNLARSSANLSGQAADVIDQALQPRGDAQSLRFSDWFRQFSNYPDVHTAQEAIDLAERTGNRANYRVAMKAGDFPIKSDFLERITETPPVQRAMKAAAEALQTRAVTEGRAAPKYQSLEYWDAVRKEISDTARAAGRAGRNEEASVFGNLAKSINNELDAQVPSYATARQGAAQFFGEENALKAGAKFVGQDFNMAQTRAVLNKMSDPERKLFQDGFVSRMMEELNRHERVMNRPQLVQRLFESPAAKERIELVLGADRARELRAMLHVENIMHQAQLATRGQSTTVQQAIGAGLAGATGGYYGGYDPTSSGLLTALTVFSKGKLDQRVATRVATMLMSHDPQVVDRGVKMIGNNERFMRILQEADSAVARVAGSQAGRRAP